MEGGNLRMNGGRSRSGRGHHRLWGGLGWDVWNTGGRHVAGGFLFVVFLFDKVVTAGRLFYDWARCNRSECAEEKFNGGGATHTEGDNATVG